MTASSSPRRIRRRLAADTGASMIELLVATGVTGLFMAATLAGLSDVQKSNDLILSLTDMNKGLRASMNIIERDMLQVGSGLPPGHIVMIPSGTGSTQVNLPGPPGMTMLKTDVGDTDIAAVIPSPGKGPKINNVDSDVLTVLMADNTFLDVALTAVTSTTVTVAAGPDLANGPDRVTPGQLMMISKGSTTTLVQVTGVNTGSRVLTFADADSLNVNQSNAAAGNLKALNAADPANSPANTRISRIRMITYYLDTATDAAHPRLVRRINNGNPTSFDNTLGTAIATDVDYLKFTFDLNDGVTNPAGVAMTATDMAGGGACGTNPCSPTQVRKVNVTLGGRSAHQDLQSSRNLRNTLTSQVAFRGMAFVDEYR
jgi:hypothetical protein